MYKLDKNSAININKLFSSYVRSQSDWTWNRNLV